MLLLSLLGHFRAERDGHPLGGIESAKGRALLAYLAVETGRPHTRTELSWLLWPDVPHATALTNLRQTLANLRNALGDRINPVPYLLIERDSIRFNLASDYQLDVAEFKLLLDTCNQHRHRHPSRCTSCAQRLERAASLYQGDFLDRFPFVDSESFEQWVTAQREPLQQQALAALEWLVEYYVRTGEHEQALAHARRVVAVAPWHEAGHQTVIKLLAYLGQRSVALLHYQQMVGLLAQELGVDPDEESRRLYMQLREGKQIEQEKPPAPKHNLPTPSNPFIGRQAVLAQLRALLEDPDRRLITIMGPGGIGKTRLALQAAIKELHSYLDGVYFVDLSPIRDPELVLQAIAQALEIREVAGEALLEQVKQYLPNKELLLLLDNFEQVISAAPLIADLLANAPALQVLITSREALNLSGEHIFGIPPLIVPDPARLPPLTALRDNEAVQLFLQRAQAVKPSFELTQSNVAAVTAICARVDGLPLAIELAAARIKSLTPETILARLGNRLRLLTGGVRDLPKRQQTLHATIDWSYQLLSHAEQKLFRRLAVFVGGATLEAVEAICNAEGDLPFEVLDGLAALVDKTLILRLDNGGPEERFGMLETIREYAYEKLVAAGEEGVVHSRLCRFFLHLVERTAPKRAGGSQKAWLDRLEREFGNLRVALQWTLLAKERDELVVGLRLAAELGLFWRTRGTIKVGREWLQQLLAKDDGRPSTERAQALQTAGHLALIQSDPSARSLLQESLAIYRQLNDTKGAADALARLGQVAVQYGEHAQASTFLVESLALYRALDDKEGLSLTLFELSCLAQERGDFGEAERFAGESLELRRVLGTTTGMAWALNRMGEVKRHLGDDTSAARYYEESLSLFTEVSDKRGMAMVSQNLAYVALRQGEHARATTLFSESLILSQPLGEGEGFITEALAGLGSVATVREQPVRAARLFGAVEARLDAVGHHLDPADRAEYERHIAVARTRLDETDFAAAWTEGRAMSQDQAIAYALEDVNGMPPAK